jgi:hypothetical protein
MSTLLRAVLPPPAEDYSLTSPLECSSSNRERELFGQPFSRFSAYQASSYEGPEELLIADARGKLSPAQMVEQKLVLLLKGKMLPLSHMRSAGSLQMRRGSVREE